MKGTGLVSEISHIPAFDMNTINSQIKERLLEKGASLVGFADLTKLPADVRDYLKFGISIVVALDASVIAGIQDGPTPEYHAEYKRANALLSNLGKIARDLIEAKGYQAIAKEPTHVGIDYKTHSTILPHKTVATRAGLGWIGKCALLVTEKYGSALRVTTVLTDAELKTAKPVTSSRCGDCMICVESCPGKAPSGKNWNLNLHRDSFFDVFACAKTAREKALAGIGIDDTICGICIRACPWTARYIKSQT
jgi:epoxyqueuosine reductase